MTRFNEVSMSQIRSWIQVFLGLCVALPAVSAALAADPWPGPLPGTEVGLGLPAGYEPSGGAWHRRLNKFLTVSDGGIVSMMNPDGTGITNWSVPGDLEGIAVADPATVDAWHAAGVANGGTTCEEPPGVREGGLGKMYLAYLRDPSGNKLCALHRMG